MIICKSLNINKLLGKHHSFMLVEVTIIKIPDTPLHFFIIVAVVIIISIMILSVTLIFNLRRLRLMPPTPR